MHVVIIGEDFGIAAEVDDGAQRLLGRALRKALGPLAGRRDLGRHLHIDALDQLAEGGAERTSAR